MGSPLHDLLGHQAWADAVFFSTWAASGAIADEDLRTRMDHAVATQEVFLSVLKGEPPGSPEHPLPEFGSLKLRCEHSHRLLRDHWEALDEAALSRTVTLPWFPDPPCVVSAADALLQVCLHNQHHRGQCMARLKAMGTKASNVDYIIWLWKGRPEPRWR